MRCLRTLSYVNLVVAFSDSALVLKIVSFLVFRLGEAERCILVMKCYRGKYHGECMCFLCKFSIIHLR